MRGFRLVRELSLLATLAAVLFSPVASLSIQAQNAQPQGLPDLVTAVRTSPGCLGVETARTATGKQVIFAWFENKDALLNWYYGDTHQMLMRMLAPGAASGHPPLDTIADDSGPILTIASLTYAPTAQVTGIQMPISQIAIELYAPLPGGLAVGGRFAPGTLNVPHLLEAPSTAGAR